MSRKIKLGDTLLEEGLITKEQLDLALQRQSESYDKLGNILIDMDFVSESNILTKLSAQLHIDYIDIFGIEIDYKLFKNYNHKLFQQLELLPFKETDNEVYVVIADPLNEEAISSIEREAGFKEVRLFLSSRNDILHIIKRYNIIEDTKSILSEVESDIKNDEVQKNFDINAKTGIDKLIHQIIKNGILHNASDIHIEPSEHNFSIRIRVDGFLREIYSFNLDVYRVLSTKIKLMGNLNITEKMLPQDGRFSLTVDKKNYDFRLSTLPSSHGESIVLRILYSDKALLKIDQLGLEEENYNKFTALTKSSNGIILITGPTGSGKTTTLYSVLNDVKSIKNKIITIEDPVEYKMPLLIQSQINEEKKLDFQRILRAILRQDPDVIMLGEVRDLETLTSMAEASMTGHLVFSTIHTNSAIGSISRMIQMGLKSYLISDSLLGATAQRLVRKNCPHCLIEYKPSQKILERLNGRKLPENMKFQKGKGCSKCDGVGYSGRTMITEVFVVTDEIKELIAAQSTTIQILKYSKEKNDFKDMLEDGIIKCNKGITTIEEVLRVL